MRGDAAQDERRQEGQRHDEGVEETVVALPHAVPHPGAVMVEALCKRGPEEPPEPALGFAGYCRRTSARVRVRLTHTVVTQAAVGGARRPEHPAGEAVLELHQLPVDGHLQGSWRRAVAGVPGAVCGRDDHQISGDRLTEPAIPADLTNLLLQLRGLVRRRAGQDPRVAEAGPEQREQHKEEEEPPDGGYAAGQVLHQEGTAGTQTEAGTPQSANISPSSGSNRFCLSICPTAPI